MFGLVSTTISFTDFADLILKLHNLALKKPFADPSQGNHGKDAKKNIDICLSSHSATKKSLSRTKSPICFAKSERSNSKGAGGFFFCFFLCLFFFRGTNQLMASWWFGILGVHPSNNPFHKGIAGTQTTNPNQQSTIRYIR